MRGSLTRSVSRTWYSEYHRVDQRRHGWQLYWRRTHIHIRERAGRPQLITAGEEITGGRPDMAFMAAIGTRAHTKKKGPTQLQPIAEDTETEEDGEEAEVAEPEPEPV